MRNLIFRSASLSDSALVDAGIGFSWRMGLMRALAKYTLLTDLVDSYNPVPKYNGGFSRSTTKTFIHGDLTVDTADAEMAAFTSSGILLEPAATNIITFSQDLSDASWTKNNCTVSANTVDVTAPDGTNTADKMTATTNTFCGVQKVGLTIQNNQTRYMSAIFKAGTAAFLRLEATNNGAGSGAVQYFNASTGAVGTSSSYGTGWSIGDKGFVALSGGWIFFWAKVLTTGTYFSHRVYLTNANNSTAITSGKTGYLWQSDNKENLSSPILTTSVSLTRTQDLLTIPTTGFKRNDFAYYLEVTPKTSGNVNHLIFANDAAIFDYIRLFENGGSWFLEVYVAGVQLAYVNLVKGLVVGTKYKILIRITPTEIILEIDNGTSTSGSNVNFANILNAPSVYIGSNGSFKTNAVFAKFKYIDTSTITLAAAEAL